MTTANGASWKDTVLRGDKKPAPYPINPDAIPQELRERPQWVTWCWDRVKNSKGELKWTKVPLRADAPKKARTNDPDTWGSFADALLRVRRGKADGIGFVFSEDDPFCGIDLDDCRNPETGALAPWAAEDVAALKSYTEVSPSGTGLKVFIRGNLPPGGNKSGHHELYDSHRFFTMTGDRLPSAPPTVEERQAELEALHARLFPAKEPRRPTPSPNGNGKSHGGCPDDQELLERARKAKNGARFAALWGGDDAGYDSASEGDLALCNMLAFWTGRDAHRVDALFRQSGRMRPKWDEVHYADGRTYGQATVEKAVADCQETYQPRQGRKRRGGSDGHGGGPPSGAGASPEAAGERLSMERTIQAHLLETLVPTHKRDTSVYSSSQGRLVRMSEAAIPTTALIDKLQQASDVPHKAERLDVVRAFGTLFKVAWGNLLCTLPTETETAEVCDPAREEFRAKVAGALWTLVSITYTYKAGTEGQQRNEVQRRPLILWAQMFATRPAWGDVRGHRLWARRDEGKVRVALRVELFKQIHCAELAGMSQRHFTELCKLYDVGAPCHVRGGSLRAIELSQEFLADQLAEPENPAAPVAPPGQAPQPDGAQRDFEARPDGQTDARPSGGRAREEPTQDASGEGQSS